MLFIYLTLSQRLFFSFPILSPQRIGGAHYVFEGKDKLEEEFTEISQVVAVTQQIHICCGEDRVEN